MRALRVGLILFAAAIAAYAQLDSDTLTITATRSLVVVPDRTQVFVNVSAPTDYTLDDVLAALRGTGISATNLSGVGGYPYTGITLFDPGPPRVGTPLMQWVFRLTPALSNLKDVLAPMARFNSPSNLRLDFYVQTMPATGVPCPWPALLEDARAQAANVAASAGMKAGSIMSLSDDNRFGVPFFSSGFLGSASRSGSFTAIVPVGAIGGLLATPQPAPILPAPACTLTVQFRLLR